MKKKNTIQTSLVILTRNEITGVKALLDHIPFNSVDEFFAVDFNSTDGNEDPADIPKLIAILKNGYDLAIASRFLPGARNEEDDQFVKFRAWANRTFTIAANILFSGNLTDSINGYRAIRKTAYNNLNIDATGFAVEFQMSIRAMKKKLKIQEIPTIEGDRIGGFSTSTAIPTGIQFVWYLLRELWIGNSF